MKKSGSRATLLIGSACILSFGSICYNARTTKSINGIYKDMHSYSSATAAGTDMIAMPAASFEGGGATSSPNFQVAAVSSAQTTAEKTQEADASIIIISNLTPSSPDISMVNMLYDSLSLLQGLSQTAPIIIAIDNLVEVGHWRHKKEHFQPNTVKNRERLDAYVRNLRLRFKDEKRVTILPFVSWQMHNYVIKYALELVETKFVYVLQHDEIFLQSINHTAMVKTMNEYPEILRKIDFHRGNNTDCTEDEWFRGPCSCNEDAVSSINEVSFTKLSGWSDQCHFTTKKYYEEVLELLGPDREHPETQMTRRAHINCTGWGPHFYGSVSEGPFIRHVHGRFTNGKKIREMALAIKEAAVSPAQRS
jgi:hypothetical protein